MTSDPTLIGSNLYLYKGVFGNSLASQNSADPASQTFASFLSGAKNVRQRSSPVRLGCGQICWAGLLGWGMFQHEFANWAV
jgi:hypothetical protein